ncbi:hypothetical protein KM043_004143 [Ampulex compressa]|nr:hypothetical protein KM043_004143 [Ampulex compressa]
MKSGSADSAFPGVGRKEAGGGSGRMGREGRRRGSSRVFLERDSTKRLDVSSSITTFGTNRRGDFSLNHPPELKTSGSAIVGCTKGRGCKEYSRSGKQAKQGNARDVRDT